MSQLLPSFGLTGGVACGKSTVARFFQDRGARIIDADRIGHELIEPGRAAYQEILQRFGEEILDPTGVIDRKKLGARVFAEPEQLRQLNALLHPPIIARVGELAREHRARDPHAVVIVDAALIFESGIGGTLRKVIVAWCRPEQQLERLMAKLGVSRQEAERRIRAQMPLEEKRRRADYVIDCSGSKEETRAQVEALFPELERLARPD
ncbi:MAG: dephospho-CoA kinase [Acidobacteriia bacterium]|nr:dephospho-CoA kinase [Terriglobia bacterium]